MKYRFKDKAITGMAVVVPEQERLFVDDMKLFNAPENRSRKLAMVMGYNAHRVVKDGVCASDLAEYGFKRLFDFGKVFNVISVKRLVQIDKLVDLLYRCNKLGVSDKLRSRLLFKPSDEFIILFCDLVVKIFFCHGRSSLRFVSAVNGSNDVFLFFRSKPESLKAFTNAAIGANERFVVGS